MGKGVAEHDEATQKELAVRVNCYCRKIFEEVSFVTKIAITIDDGTTLAITREGMESQLDN